MSFTMFRIPYLLVFSRFFLGWLLCLSFVRAQAAPMSLQEQTDCLCRVSTYCETGENYYWVANSTNGGQPVLTLAGSEPMIFDVSLQGDRRAYGSNIYLAEIPNQPTPIPIALHFEEDGKVRYYQRLSRPSIELQAGLAHWQRMRSLQTLLFEEFGISSQPDERGFGTGLLIESYHWGLLTAQDPALGRHLGQLVQEFDAGFVEAQQFERENRELFSGCNGADTLCQHGPNGQATLQPVSSQQSRQQWTAEFERQVRIFTRNESSSIENLCQEEELSGAESSEDKPAISL